MGAVTRRALFGTGAGLALAGSAAAAPRLAKDIRSGDTLGLDAELLAACADFDALERAYQRTDFSCIGGSPEDLASDAERDRISTAQYPLVNRMGELQAFTRAGRVARARSLALWKPDLLNDAPGDFAEVLMAAIVRDLIGEA